MRAYARRRIVDESVVGPAAAAKTGRPPNPSRRNWRCCWPALSRWGSVRRAWRRGRTVLESAGPHGLSASHAVFSLVLPSAPQSCLIGPFRC